MIRHILAAVAAVAFFAVPAQAQQAAQWNYGFVNNTATATYPGNVVVGGTISGGLAPPITLNCGTLTTDVACLALSATWNNAAVTFEGIKFDLTDTASGANSNLLEFNVGGSPVFSVGKAGRVRAGDGTAALPGYSLAGDTSTGFFEAAGGAFGFSSGGAEALRLEGTLGIGLRQGSSLWWTNANNGAFSNRDLVLTRDAANVLAQRNGTNSQTFRLYSSYSDIANYERLNLGWVPGYAELATTWAGTGTTKGIQFSTQGTARWQIGATTGNLFAATDNAYDFGASGSNRPRTGYFGTSVIIGFDPGGSAALRGTGNVNFTGSMVVGPSSVFAVSGKSNISSPNDGQLLFRNNDRTDFDLLQFGGSTSSYPALKRSATALQARLADDSGFAPFEAASVTSSGAISGTTVTGSGTVTGATVVSTGVVKTQTGTVASLPTCNAGNLGARAFVTDSTTAVYDQAAVGGGTNPQPVFCNGVVWKIG